MKRALRIAVLCLLLGAAVDVAVACGCAVWSRCVFKGRSSSTHRPPTRFTRYLPPDWPDDPRSHFLERADGPGLSVQRLSVPIEDGLGFEEFFGFDRTLVIIRAGWPAPALECDTVVKPAGLFASVKMNALWRGGVQAPQWVRPRAWYVMYAEFARPIPLRPIWWGFVLNTLLYGAACWVLLGAARGVRCAVRRRGGRCVACGYPVRGLAACPECGRQAGGAVDGCGVVQESGGAYVAGGVAAPVVAEPRSARREVGEVPTGGCARSSPLIRSLTPGNRPAPLPGRGGGDS